MKILTAEAMAAVDRRAIEEIGLPGAVLMENAAQAVLEALCEAFPEAERIAVLCGPGNNGGDGLALARHLWNRGFGVQVFLWEGKKGLRGDARLQLRVCEAQGVPIERLEVERPLVVVERIAAADLLVDALFGTGLRRPLAGALAELVQALDELGLARLAVDLPSGLSGDSGEIPGPSLRADLTVTFGLPKVPHVLPPAVERVGRVAVADLGIPAYLLAEAESRLHLLVPEEMAACQLPRAATVHKGELGHVLVIAGGRGTAGAAILAARGAIRAGAGLVTLAVPEGILRTVEAGSVESMSLPVPETSHGGLSAAAAEPLARAAATRDVVAMGPGLGREEETFGVVVELARTLDRPLVLDADGLNAFAGRLDLLSGRPAPTVLTPHPGEAARLLGSTTAVIGADRIAAAREAASRSGAVVVLKGFQTAVAAPTGDVFLNSTGNPGMATGGTGDVLTGMIAGLVGQGYAALTAAQLAVHLHGLAGDLAAAAGSEAGLAAGDILEHLPRAQRRLAAT